MTVADPIDLLASENGIALRDRPSAVGAVIGKALALLAEAGRATDPSLPSPCATCAFRRGAMSNAMPATVLAAFECVATSDEIVFGCHQGLIDRQPSRACAGWLAARAADSAQAQLILANLHVQLGSLDEYDEVRASFDAWVARVDAEGRLDDHERGRLWLRDHAVKPQS